MIYTAEKLQKGAAPAMETPAAAFLSMALLRASVLGAGGFPGQSAAVTGILRQDQPYPSEAITRQIIGKGRHQQT